MPRYLVFDSREGSGYADSTVRYEFPTRYLQQFDPWEPTVAIVYEPSRSHGRKSYVAWGIMDAPPKAASRGLYTVDFRTGLLSFDRPVPFQTDGTPAEWSLREVPKQDLGRALRGRAIRTIHEDNALEILMAGSSDLPPVVLVPSAVETAFGRGRLTVERLERSARFRDQVLRAYSFRCAVTGLSARPQPASRLSGLIEAAHVRSIASDGPDVLENGLAMTPTIHRLFDAGYISLRVGKEEVLLQTSGELAEHMVKGHTGTDLALAHAKPLDVPRTIADSEAFRSFAAHHRRNVFRN